jgi:hypothetical protein
MEPLDTRQSQMAMSWAHYALADAKRRERKRQSESGVRTLILIDADIMIGQSNPGTQTGLFEDLLDADVAQRFSAPLNAFFYDWVYENVRRPAKMKGVEWGTSPEHFREVINKAEGWLDEPDEPAPLQPSLAAPEGAFLHRLTSVLHRLEANPWSNVDGDVAALLSILGVNFEAPSRWEIIDTLKNWLDCLQKHGHVPGTRSPHVDAHANLGWPRFRTDAELAILRIWRGRLWDARHEADTHRRPAHDTASVTGIATGERHRRPALGPEQERPPRTKNLDADARVLAALTLLNRDWRKTKQRVELLTASKYVLRAVACSALLPSPSREEPDDFSAGTMADFVHMPSMILAEDLLWDPVEAERDIGAQTIAEWGMPRVDESANPPARWFALINAKDAKHDRSGGLTTVSAAPDLDPHVFKLGRSFRHFFSQKVSKSVALAQVRDRLGTERGAKAAWTREQLRDQSIDEIRQRASELSELRRIQLRVDMLEYLIQAHFLKQDLAADSGSANPLRTPPKVDFGEPDSAWVLWNALTRLPPTSQDKLNQIKLQVFRDDPSTYKLALVYACVYASRSLWRLAASAADYAFLLSQTSEYRATRPERVLGDEAKLLQLACLRRAAHTPSDIDRADRLLEDYRQVVPRIRNKEPLVGLRLELEHSSLLLTRLLMEFFSTGDERLPPEFRSKVGDALHLLVELQTSNADLLAGPQSGVRDVTRRDIIDRMLANTCNLAWLSVGWSFGELSRSSMLAPRRGSLARHHNEMAVDVVHSSLKTLSTEALKSIESWRTHPTHELLTTFTACMVMAPELLGLSDPSMLHQVGEALDSWQSHRYEHPYDQKRIEYARTLVRNVHSR